MPAIPPPDDHPAAPLAGQFHGPPDSRPEAARHPHREEVRFAVVLNGGVSLAVWMGGVVHELDAVTAGYDEAEDYPDHAYGRLMQALGLRARADVIAGTSAGGINGAALALAQVNRSADLAMLRDMWAQQGRMETLLQRPFSGQPASLLRGEEYFLPKLQEAMARLSLNWTPRTSSDRPVDLTITTTLLDGALTTTTDSMGTTLPQLRYDGQFSFRRGFKEVVRTETDGQVRFEERDVDDFDGATAMAERLGLAARCSAGFPVAFEPSYVPVGRAVDGRPDMDRFANWSRFRGAQGATGRAERSRFAVDGGVLSNTPTREALKVIQQLGATEPVQRVMLLVFPHAPTELAVRAPEADQPPTLPASLTSMLDALRADGGRTHVDAIEEHNRRAACRRQTRDQLMADAAQLSTLAGQLFESYRTLRIQRAARDLPDRIDLPETWSFERARATCLQAQEAHAAEHDRALPYVPKELWPDRDHVDWQRWGWGATAALDIADTALAAIDSIRDQNRTDQLDRAAGAIHLAMSQIRVASAELDETLRRVRYGADSTAEAVLAAGPDVEYWRRRLAVYDYYMNGAVLARDRVPGPLADRRGAGGQVTASAVRSILRHLQAAWATGGEASDSPYAWLFADLPEIGPEDRVGLAGLAAHRPALLRRMLQLHVVSWTIGDENLSDNTRPVELVQLSAQGRHEFATYAVDMASKLGSDDLARFGGFLKTSWRMNDWAWGRLDAAVMLLQILLRPSRIKRFATRFVPLGQEPTAAQAGRVVEELFAHAAGLALTAELRARYEDLDRLYTRACAEVAELLGMADDDSIRSPALARLLAFARQVETIVADLPAVASGIRADIADGGGERGAGAGFLHTHRELLGELGQLAPLSGLDEAAVRAERARRFDLGVRALHALDQSGIGREQVKDVASTDQTIRTAMTAAAVVGTVADGPSSGLGRLKPVTKFVRGALLLPYWITLGLTSTGAIARLLAVLALAGGATVLALAVLGVLPQAIAAGAAMVGAGTVLFVFVYAAARTGSTIHAFAFLTVGAPLLVVGVDRVADSADDSSGTALAVLLAVVGVVLLGSVPNPIVSPVAVAASSAWRRLWQGTLMVVGFVVAAAVLAVLVIRWFGDDIEDALDRLYGAVTGLSDRVQVGLGAVGLVLLAVAVLVAWRRTIAASRVFALIEWTAEGEWERQGIRHPGALFAAWAPVYGAVVAAATAALWALGWVSPPWAVAGLVAAVLFTFLVPFVVLRSARRAVLRALRRGVELDARLSVQQPAQLAGEGPFAQWLVTRGLNYELLLKEGGSRDPRMPRVTDMSKDLLSQLQERDRRSREEASSRPSGSS